MIRVQHTQSPVSLHPEHMLPVGSAFRPWPIVQRTVPDLLPHAFRQLLAEGVQIVGGAESTSHSA